MSMRSVPPLLLALPLGVAMAAPPPPVAMKPGLWETVQTTETPATNSKRTVTSQACFSADDVKIVARVLPRQHEAPLKCENRDPKSQKDGAIEWRIACTGPGGAVNGTGRMVPAAETFTATATLNAKTAGKPVKSEQTVSGKWISDCK